MTEKEKKQASSMPKEALDKMILDKFGVKATTEFNIVTMTYITRIEKECKDRAKLLRIKDFIDGFTSGNIELANRLPNRDSWI